MSKISKPVITKGVRKTPQKDGEIGTKNPKNFPRNPGFKRTGLKRKTQTKLKGKSKEQFDEIPDSISNFSKITGNRSNHLRGKKEKKEVKLTDKPTNIRISGDMAIIEERDVAGTKGRKEVTDKPNNIRAPMF